MAWLPICFGVALVYWALNWLIFSFVLGLPMGHPARKLFAWPFFLFMLGPFWVQGRLCHYAGASIPRWALPLGLVAMNYLPVIAILCHFGFKQQSRIDRGELVKDNLDPISVKLQSAPVQTIKPSALEIDPHKQTNARRVLYGALVAFLLLQAAFVLGPSLPGRPMTLTTRLALVILLNGITLLQTWFKRSRKPFADRPASVPSGL